jgi:PadR family transcriptional regulator PadR
MEDNNQLAQRTAQIRKSLIEYCVLLICAKESVYTGEILMQLQEAEMIVVEGTVYPLLNRLRKEGTLDYKWVESDAGPPRKYYHLTDQGKTTLADYHKQWAQLNKTITNLKKGSKK